jgi:hypothetical protein
MVWLSAAMSGDNPFKSDGFGPKGWLMTDYQAGS